jgi:hypothetical protein
VDDAVMGSPGAVEGEVVSISSSEPSDMAEVAQSSGTGGSTTLVWMGHDPFQWGGSRLTWLGWSQLEAPPVFVLDDVEELDAWSRIQTGCQSLNQALTIAFNALHDDICSAGLVR